MKTTRVPVLLPTATVCSAQPARTREITNASRNNPDLSLEAVHHPFTGTGLAAMLAPDSKLNDVMTACRPALPASVTPR